MSSRRPSGAVAWLVRLVSLVVVIALWQLFFQLHVVTSLILVSPLSTAQQLWALLTLKSCDPQCLPQALETSMSELVVGFALTLVVGLAVGIGLGLYRAVDRSVRPFIILLFTIPHIIFLFVFIFVLGYGFETKAAYIFFGAFPVLVLNVSNGIRNVERVLVDVGKGFNCNTRQLVTKIIIPASMPYIVSGLRIALAVSFIVLVVAETFIGFTGIGAIVHNAGHEWLWDEVFAGAIVISGVALALSLATLPLEKRYFRRMA